MAATITSVSITPQTVNAGAQLIISVGVSWLPLTFSETDAMTWNQVDTLTWNEVDKTA